MSRSKKYTTSFFVHIINIQDLKMLAGNDFNKKDEEPCDRTVLMKVSDWVDHGCISVPDT